MTDDVTDGETLTVFGDLQPGLTDLLSDLLRMIVRECYSEFLVT